MAERNEAGEGDFVITRVFQAPRELVFAAWTEPKHMAQWWGPRMFTAPVCEMDVRPGGKFRLVMRGPNGSDHPARGVYREIVRPSKLVMVMDHSELPEEWHDIVNPHRDKTKGRPAYAAHMTITFEEDAGKTTLTVRSRFESAAVRDMFLKLGMTQGWSSSLEKLADHLEDRALVIQRLVDAPAELVWQAMTDPKHVVHWWGPRGFTTTVEQMDVRPGGQWIHVMHGPDGTEYPNHCVFSEVAPPHRLVFTDRGGKKGGTEARFESTWTFDSPPGGKKTMVTVRMVFASTTDRDKIVKEYGAAEGGHQTLARLSEYLPAMNRAV
jgi:uncharacterized protein YndB with AHSA1/START domain